MTTVYNRWAALLLLLVLVLAACSSTDDTTDSADDGGGEDAAASDEPDEGTDDDTDADDTDADDTDADDTGDGAAVASMRAAITGDEGTLTPYTYVTGFPGWNLLMLQYDSLMQIDVDGVPQPWLAETVDVSDDGLTYDLTLVEGVTWHDGEPFTSDDVVFTVDYFLANAAGRFSRNLGAVTEATADGDLGVTLTLEAPSPSFPLSTLSDVPILPEHIWSTVEDPETHQFEGPNIGTGPYTLEEYQADTSYRLVANPDYFRGTPTVDELVIVQFADDAGALAAIRSGEVDVVFDQIAPEQVDLLGQQGTIEIAQGPEYSSQLLYFDASKAPFDDIAVRQAMSLAVDRQDLVDTVFLGAATVGSAGWIHPDQPTFNSAVETTTDVEQANTLLEDAGYTDGDGDGIREADGEPMSYELLTPSGDSLRLRTAELVAAMLADIGIQANVSSVEQATWEEAVWPGFDVANGRNYDLAMWGWSAPIQADASRVASLVHSEIEIGSLNLTAFADPEMDEVAQALTVEGDDATRTELIGELQSLFAERLPFVTLLYPDGAYAYDAAVYDGWAFVNGQGIVSKLSLLEPAARP
ncbi:ABC transporter substrate-binding protein [Euzebya rosea]|uniref:ABC transporter substrate-binding protein n=1 Tax=Euzebya rosea TaxID=2052804 RepID=UPI000D3E7BCB|nr:ABC transporter substrate-binding protein [Euzebya rosea]